jgi:TRAP-type C4-dicarboxylate transport system substrate-binding protein
MEGMNMKKALARVIRLSLVFLLLASLMEVAGAGETITLKIGGGHPSNTMSYTAVAKNFFQVKISERAAAETPYRVEWVDAYGGTIAKLAEGLTACQDGILDILVNSYGFDNMKLFLMNMPYYVPFSSPDPIVANKASRAAYDKYKKVFEDLWENYNQKFLAFGPTGSYELITNFPVKSITDLRGHKVAAAGANLPWLEGSGAVPVQSNLNEAYTCIQTGVYDGWVMWPDAAYRFKLHEVAPYYTMVGFGACPIQGISINLDVWNDLPPAIQKIIEDVAAEYEVESAKVAKEWDVEALEKMKGEGVTITAFAPEDAKKWADGLADVPQIRATEANEMGFPGTGIWNAYLDSQREQGYAFPREWLVK